MSRYADQLPIITEPTPGNYLLGTDENDPKALVRIPAEGLGGGGSTEYTILDETALDVDSNVALSAGLYLYVGNAPANFDLSGLVDGERVEIINHTAHKCYLFGFTNWVWNGINTALQENKGLILEKGGLIGAKHNGNLLLFNILPNPLAQNFRVGLAPLFTNYPYVAYPTTATSDTYNRSASNYDIFYQLSTNFLTESFVNAHDRGLITITASGIRDNNGPPYYQPQYVIDNKLTAGTAEWGNFYGNGPHWLKIDFKTRSVRLERFWIYHYGISNISNLDLYGSNDNTTWTLITDLNVTQTNYLSPVLTDLPFYRYFKFIDPRTNPNAVAISEICFWGDLL
jgi:hypothetical protein